MSNWIDQLTKAYQSMEEKKKLDPVGQADADIDNDGDVDSSDEYLHKRRKAIKKASKEEQASCDSGKKRVKEEMDPTDHVKQKDGGKYCVYDKDGEVVAEFDSEAEANAYAKKNHDKLMGESVEEVQELNKSTLKIIVTKLVRVEMSSERKVKVVFQLITVTIKRIEKKWAQSLRSVQT